MLHYFARIGIALSVLLNVILGGPSNQTFSARNYGWQRAGRHNLVFLIDAVSNLIGFILTKVLTFIVGRHIVIQLDKHCLEAWAYWRCRKDVVAEHEEKL